MWQIWTFEMNASSSSSTPAKIGSSEGKDEDPRLVESLPQVVVEKEAIQVGKMTTGKKKVHFATQWRVHSKYSSRRFPT